MRDSMEIRVTKDLPAIYSDELSAPVLALPIGLMRLGLKANKLKESGIETIADLLGVLPLKRQNSYGIGPSSIDKLASNLSALLVLNEGGALAWERYANAAGVVLLPTSAQYNDAQGFLNSLPQVLEQIAGVLTDSTDADILLSRLSKKPRDQKTLEEIGAAATPKVTRERIRQKEKKLLQQIAGGLIWHEYGNLNLLFRPEFSSWWMKAAEHFSGHDEISFEDFVSGLATVWNAEVADIVKQLPIILAVVTGEVHMSGEFRNANRLDNVYFRELPDVTRGHELKKFRLGTVAEQIADSGYETLGRFIGGCLSGQLFEEQKNKNAVIRAIEHFNKVKSVFDNDMVINWLSYRELNNLQVVPSNLRRSASEFAAHLVEDLTELIGCMKMYSLAGEVYRLRSSQPVITRLTLEKLSAELKTTGPNCKRTETVTLERLNDLIISRDFSNQDFWMCDKFLQWWKEAELSYQLSAKNFDAFKALLQDRWSLTDEVVEKSIPSLWGVLNGYPNGYPRRGRPRKGARADVRPDSVVGIERIRMVGFRRIH